MSNNKLKMQTKTINTIVAHHPKLTTISNLSSVNLGNQTGPDAGSLKRGPSPVEDSLGKILIMQMSNMRRRDLSACKILKIVSAR